MKTQVIQLDAHDDVVSVRDRLTWGRAGRVVLVWPERGHILQRQLDLVLLKRFAQRNGMQIGLVTRDPIVLEHAHETGLPVFEDLVHAQQGRWRGAKRRQRYSFKKERPDIAELSAARQSLTGSHKAAAGANKRLPRAVLFFTSLVSVLLVLASILPGAVITLQPLESEQIIEQSFTASYQPAAGQFSLQPSTIVVEARSSIPTSGQVSVPKKTAVGSVQFTNLTENEVGIPVGTVVTTLSSPVVRFVTTKAGKAPAGFGRTALLDVSAVDPGVQGNLLPGSLQAIEGSLGLFLTANNIYKTHGGSNQIAAGPGDADRAELLSKTLEELEAQARKEIFERWQTSPTNHDFPIVDTLRLDEILEQSYTPAEDWPSSELELKLRVSFSADSVPGDQLAQFLITAMDSQLDFGQEPLSAPMKIELTREPVMVGNLREEAERAWQWELQARRPIRKAINENQVSMLSRFLPAKQAGTILQNSLGLEFEPVVQVWPSWWPYLPVTTLRIQVLAAP